jgi:hypothetical protein
LYPEYSLSISARLRDRYFGG